MKRWTIGIVVAGLLFAGAPLVAQKSPDLGEVTVWKVKDGAAAAFAEGRKKHMDFHRQQKDTWTWYTWEIVNGDRAGQFITGSFGHYWKDFDGREAFDALDSVDVAKTFGPHATMVTTGTWAMVPEMSRTRPDTTGPPKFSQLTHYQVKLAEVPDFEDAVKEISAALTKIEWPVYSTWYRLVSGGEGPHYVLSTARASWADFAPTEKSLLEGLTEAVGARRATELLDTVRGATKSLYTEVMAYRPELSYLAPAAK